jgi:hypothetical protein
MKRGPVIAEIAAWTLFFPIAVVLMVRRLLGYGRETPEARVDALLRWYPARWREHHGETYGQLLLDAIADGRGDLRMSIDVAREGVLERRRAFRRERLWGGALLTAGYIMVVPQGIVAAILGFIPGMPRSWFLALYVDGAERFLVLGGMVAVGLLLLDRGMQILGADCAARKARTAVSR